nr:hypothetical protein BAR15_180110 [Bartonella sp. AR 15-3]
MNPYTQGHKFVHNAVNLCERWDKNLLFCLCVYLLQREISHSFLYK